MWAEGAWFIATDIGARGQAECRCACCNAEDVVGVCPPCRDECCCVFLHGLEQCVFEFSPFVTLNEGVSEIVAFEEEADVGGGVSGVVQFGAWGVFFYGEKL